MAIKNRVLFVFSLVAGAFLALVAIPASDTFALSTYNNYITFSDSNGDLTCTSPTTSMLRPGTSGGREDFYSNSYLSTQSSSIQSEYEHLRVLNRGGFTGIDQCLQGSFNGLTFNYSDFYTDDNGFTNGEVLISSGDYILTIYTTNDVFANSNVNFLNFIKGKNLYDSTVISDIQNNFTFSYTLDEYASYVNPNIYFGLYNYYSLNGGSNMVMEFKLSIENDISYNASEVIYYFTVGSTNTQLTLNDLDNSYYMTSSLIPVNGLYYTLSLDSDKYEFGTIPDTPSDDSTDPSSPSADFNAEQDYLNQNGSTAQNSASQLNFSGFSVGNPLLNWLSLFSDNTCVAIPTIASWIHSNETQVCSPWSAEVRSVTTPIISVLGGTILFGFIVRWLKQKDGQELS